MKKINVMASASNALELVHRIRTRYVSRVKDATHQVMDAADLSEISKDV